MSLFVRARPSSGMEEKELLLAVLVAIVVLMAVMAVVLVAS